MEKDGRAISKVFIIIQFRSILTRQFVFPEEENIIGNRIRWFSSNRNSDFPFISQNRLEDGNGLRTQCLLLLTSPPPFRRKYLFLVLSVNLFWWVKLKFYLWNCNLCASIYIFVLHWRSSYEGEKNEIFIQFFLDANHSRSYFCWIRNGYFVSAWHFVY